MEIRFHLVCNTCKYCYVVFLHLQEMEKERDVFLVKMKAVKDQRSKLAAELEAKVWKRELR